MQNRQRRPQAEGPWQDLPALEGAPSEPGCPGQTPRLGRQTAPLCPSAMARTPCQIVAEMGYVKMSSKGSRQLLPGA